MADNLLNRKGIWYARFYIPLNEQDRLGKREYVWSLKTGDLREARRRLPAMQARFESLISPPDPLRADLERRYGIPASLPAAEVVARLSSLLAAAHAADDRHWSDQRPAAAAIDPLDFGIDPANPPADPHALSPERYRELRLEAASGHRADDPAFQAAAEAAGLQGVGIDVEGAAQAAGLTITPAPSETTTWSLVDGWIRERKPSGKAIQEMKSSIKILDEITGEKPIGDYTKKDLIAVKNHLLSQPGKDGDGLASDTINKRLNLLKGLFSYAAENEIIDTNLMVGVSVPKTKYTKRKPFTEGDLDLLFDPAKLPLLNKPSYRWLLLLGLYTGARLNELCQLRCNDLKQDKGVWYLEIDSEDHDEHGQQRVKNDNSVRHTVLHPSVIDSGFIDFVGQRQGMMFSGVYYSEEQGYSKDASKYLNEYIHSIVPDQRKVYHSFRHTLKTLARNSGVPEDFHDQHTGHAGGHVGRDYGHGAGLQMALEHLKKIEGRWKL